MSAFIYALFDNPDIAMKAVADLEAAGIMRSDITIVEGGDRTGQEASHILDQHRLSSETTTAYIHALGQGGAFLWLRLDPARQSESDMKALLERNGSILVDAAAAEDPVNPDDELNEAEGWDDFTTYGNEHSPDSNAESMWKDRHGRVR